MNMVKELEENQKTPRLNRRNNTEKESWNKPLIGWLKVNAEAGVFSDGTLGLGFVVRNKMWEVKLAGARRCRVPTQNSTLTEALTTL